MLTHDAPAVDLLEQRPNTRNQGSHSCAIHANQRNFSSVEVRSQAQDVSCTVHAEQVTLSLSAFHDCLGHVWPARGSCCTEEMFAISAAPKQFPCPKPTSACASALIGRVFVVSSTFRVPDNLQG